MRDVAKTSCTPQVVVVSGGSKGLGAALVEDRLQAGCVVATFSRSRSDTVERWEREFPDKARYFWRAVDASDPESVKNFGMDVLRRFRRIDALVNNAAVAPEALATMLPYNAVQRAVAVNLEAAFVLTQVCLKGMIRQKSGSIVNISSVTGVRGFAGVAVYGATKAGINGFTINLARELGPIGVRVNAVAPGFFDSAMTAGMSQELRGRIVRRTPLGRLAHIEDILNVIRFLLSDEANFVTGQVVAVDGGLTC